MKVLIVSLFIAIVDQLTKLFVKGGTIPLLNIKIDGMYYGQSIDVFGNFFKITFVENPGLAFGIDVNETGKLFLSLFSLIASIGILYYLYKSRDQKFVTKLSLAFILGGAIGNLIDRTFYGVFYDYGPLFYGKVVDFFNVDFFDFTIFGRTYERWPIFNIADASVTVGVVLLIFFHRSVAEEEKQKPQITNELKTDITESVEPGETNQLNNSEELVTSNSSLSDVENSNREEV